MTINRSLALALVLGLALVACKPNTGLTPCADSSVCTLVAGGQCLPSPEGIDLCAYPATECPSGLSWSPQAGDLAGECVGSDVDAAETDAATTDAVDATPIDTPSGSIVIDNQGAEIVLGQPDFMTATRDYGGTAGAPTDRSLAYPNGLASDGSSLWIVDAGQGRALRWTPMPSGSYVAATGILGKSSFIDGTQTGGSNASNIADTCCGPRAVIGGNKLIVSDSTRNRVMIWSPLPTTPGQAANLVLGQPSLTSASFPPSGSGANQLNYPTGVWTDGTRIIVADTGNNRVLVWHTFPTTENGAPADLVLGQPGFGSSTLPTSPTASTLKRPRGVHFDGTHLYVTDDFGRVMIWNSLPNAGAHGTAADIVVGKPDFMTASAGPPASNLDGPEAVVTSGNALFVADTINSRVMVYSPIPTASGASATYSLGQISPAATPDRTPLPTQSSLSQPAALVVVGSYLFVSARDQHRVLRFSLNL